MSMRRLMATAASGLVLAFGAGPMTTLNAQGQGTDQQFVTQVAGANLLEVRMGQAAQQKGENLAVKQFAQQMIIDHTNMQKQWMAVAKKLNIPFKADLLPQQVQQAEQLKNLSKADFDKAYMSLMVQNHSDNVSTFTRERSASHSADVRQLIESSLPGLQQHLTQAQQVSGQLGGDVAVAAGAPMDTSPVAAQPTDTARISASVRADSGLIMKVDASNSAELRLSRLAQEKATNSQVRQFAQRMVTEHQSMQSDWRGVASRNGVPIRTNLEPSLQQQITLLNQLSGAEFDRGYMTAMVDNHRDALNVLQSIGLNSNSTEVRALVNRGLPVVQEHLRLAEQIYSQGGRDSIATISGNNGNKGNKGETEAQRKFIGENNAEDFLHIQIGKLAEKKAKDSSVKQFGQRMASQYTDMLKQWTDMETKNNLPVPPGMGPNHQVKLTKLEKLSGPEFDRAYISVVIKDLAGHLSYHRKEGRASTLAPVRQLVEKRIPVMEEQLRQATAIGNRIGADTTPSRDAEISGKDK